MSRESANRAVEWARTPATDSVTNITTLISRTIWSVRRCSRGISRTSQQSSMMSSGASSGLAAAASGPGRRRLARLFRLVARLGAADLGERGFLQRLADVVADPLGVPPLERRDRRAVDQHLVVEVITHRQAGRAGPRDLLTFLDGVADLHGRAREMGVERLQTEPVVDHHRVAVDRERLGEHDHALVRGRHRRLSRRRQVVPEMDLPVDLFAAVHVAARLGEIREHLGVACLHERPVPERLVGGAGADLLLWLLLRTGPVAGYHQKSRHPPVGGWPLRAGPWKPCLEGSAPYLGPFP